MDYENFETGEVIIKQNDPSNDKLYAIMTGTVNVIVDIDDSNYFLQ